MKLVRGVATVPDNARTTDGERGQRHGDSAIASMMLQHASDMEVMEFGYTPAPRARGRLDEGPADAGGRMRMRPEPEPTMRVRQRGAW